jgi:NADH:ubiquinone oxidoreductase subunit 5 (subunit L)/multisubunit Na+/H+ antiporter MnhA subunit
MTGFYMFRLMGKTFYGKGHVDPEIEPKIHESPRSMTVPLLLLAVPTIFLGLAIGLPLGDSTILHWLEPIFLPAEEMLAIEFPEYELFGIDGALIIGSVAVAALGIGVAIWLFGIFNSRARLETVESLTARNRMSRFLYTASLNKWYFDDLNHLVFYRFGGKVANGVMWFDVKVVDGVVNGVGSVTQSIGDNIRHVQTGRVQNYALDIAIGLVVVAGLFLLMAR